MASTNIQVKHVQAHGKPAINIQYAQMKTRTRRALYQARQMPGVVVRVLSQRPATQRIVVTLD